MALTSIPPLTFKHFSKWQAGASLAVENRAEEHAILTLILYVMATCKK